MASRPGCPPLGGQLGPREQQDRGMLLTVPQPVPGVRRQGPPPARQTAQREADDLVADYMAYRAGLKRSTATLKANKAAIASWLDWNSQRFGRKIKARGQTRPRASRYGLPTN